MTFPSLFFTTDAEGIDHEVSSTEWEKKRPSRRYTAWQRTPALKFVDYPPTEVLVVDGLVGSERGRVEVEHDELVACPE